jgi:predicted transcriptional regulator
VEHPGEKPWTFLTNHARVLVAVARDPHTRVSDIADRIGITERAVQRILTELETGGYLTRTRTGRRTSYTIDPAQPLDDRPRPVGVLLNLLTGPPQRRHSDRS